MSHWLGSQNGRNVRQLAIFEFLLETTTMHPANSLSSFHSATTNQTKKGNYLKKKIISLWKDIGKYWFLFLHTLRGFMQRESKCHIVKLGSDSVANRLISIFHLCNTHTHDMLFFFSLLIRAAVPTVDDWLKKSRLNLFPEAPCTSQIKECTCGILKMQSSCSHLLTPWHGNQRQ